MDTNERDELLTEILQASEDIYSAKIDGALERLCEKLQSPPNIDALRLIALGMSIACKPFREKLFLEIGDGSNAWGSMTDLVVMVILERHQELLSSLGFESKSKEKFSDAVIRLLSENEVESFHIRNDRVALMMNEILGLVSKLGMLARATNGCGKNGQKEGS